MHIQSTSQGNTLPDKWRSSSWAGRAGGAARSNRGRGGGGGGGAGRPRRPARQTRFQEGAWGLVSARYGRPRPTAEHHTPGKTYERILFVGGPKTAEHHTPANRRPRPGAAYHTAADRPGRPSPGPGPAPPAAPPPAQPRTRWPPGWPTHNRCIFAPPPSAGKQPVANTKRSHMVFLIVATRTKHTQTHSDLRYH